MGIPYHTYHMGVSSHYAYLPYHTIPYLPYGNPLGILTIPYHTILTIWESIMHTYHTIPYHTYHMGVSSHYAYLPHHTILTIWESIMHTCHTIPYLPYRSQLTLCILTILYHTYHIGVSSHYAYLPCHTILTIWESVMHTYLL